MKQIYKLMVLYLARQAADHAISLLQTFPRALPMQYEDGELASIEHIRFIGMQIVIDAEVNPAFANSDF